MPSLSRRRSEPAHRELQRKVWSASLRSHGCSRPFYPQSKSNSQCPRRGPLGLFHRARARREVGGGHLERVVGHEEGRARAVVKRVPYEELLRLRAAGGLLLGAREAVRRMLHAGISGAWQAWLELYEAR